MDKVELKPLANSLIHPATRRTRNHNKAKPARPNIIRLIIIYQNRPVSLTVHSKKSVFCMKTAYIGRHETDFHFEVAICIALG